MQDFTQLGIAGATLLILLIVVRYFIQAIEKKDTYIQQITEKFSETVNSHLTRENEMMVKATDVLNHHTEVLSGHTQVLAQILQGMQSVEKVASRITYGRRKSDKKLIERL